MVALGGERELRREIDLTPAPRAGDPPGYTNTFAYNGDGEMIGRTNAELDTAEYTFDSANLDRLQQGNLRQVLMDMRLNRCLICNNLSTMAASSSSSIIDW